MKQQYKKIVFGFLVILSSCGLVIHRLHYIDMTSLRWCVDFWYIWLPVVVLNTAFNIKYGKGSSYERRRRGYWE